MYLFLEVIIHQLERDVIRINLGGVVMSLCMCGHECVRACVCVVCVCLCMCVVCVRASVFIGYVTCGAYKWVCECVCALCACLRLS